MNDDEAIKILKDLYDYGNLPERCLLALSKGMSALKYQRAAKTAIEKSAETVRSLQSRLGVMFGNGLPEMEEK